MCRWMAWSGQPLRIAELLFNTEHGLVDQSRHARLATEPTNGDGFGLGWYGTGIGPGAYRRVVPAWADANLRHLSAHIESPLFMAHVRASSGSVVQESNCHPFQHGRWLLVHNGQINDFHTLRRDLMLAVAPERFAEIVGSTDTEVLLALAVTYGLEHDPLGALERAIGLVEAEARRHGIEHAVQATIGLSDGERLWAVRYATDAAPPSLFVSADAEALRQLHPDNPRLQQLRHDDRLVVSEPLVDLPGAWHEVNPSTALVVTPDGGLDHRPFHPQPPSR